MVDPEALKTALEATAIVEGIKAGQAFFAAAAGKSGRDIPTILGEFVHDRIANVQSIGSKAHLTLLNLELPPREIPFNILYPAMEAASLQDDPSIQDTWANLFAHAADPRQETPVGPKFAYMLRDLGPREVKFLDALYLESLRRLNVQSHFTSAAQIQYGMGELRELYGTLGFSTIKDFNAPTFEEQQHPDYKKQTDAFYLMLDVIRSNEIVRNVPIPGQSQGLYSTRSETIRHVFGLSDLGVAFIKACRPVEK